MTAKNKSASSQILPVVSIPGYQIRTVLGRGGMAIVYLAVQESINREVALKILAPDHTDDSFSDRFLREAQIVSKLTHPNIVTIYDAGVHAGYNYIAMEYIAGKNLVEAHTDLSYKQRIEIIKQIALALDYAGKKGYVHRDIKPENIMLADDGRAVLTDFGIARGHDVESGLTLTGKAIGTPYFMSPEQTKGQPVDHRSDIYSLGVVLFQALSGYVPYDGPSVVAIGIKHISAPLPTLPKFMEQLQPIINKCLAKNPQHRYQTALELHDALAAIAESDLDFISAKAKAAARFHTGVHQAHTLLEDIPVAIPADQRASRYSELSQPFKAPATHRPATARATIAPRTRSRHRLLWTFLLVFSAVGVLAFHKRSELEHFWLTQLGPLLEQYLLADSNRTEPSSTPADDLHAAVKADTGAVHKPPLMEPPTQPARHALTDLPETRLQVRLLRDKLRMNPTDDTSQQTLQRLHHWYLDSLDQTLQAKDILKANTLLTAYREDFPETGTQQFALFEQRIQNIDRLLQHLQQAKVYLAANAVDKPDGANALEEYLAALRIAPDDNDVKTGLIDIARYFHDKATRAQQDARLTEALSHAMSGLRAVPDDPALKATHSRLLAQIELQRELNERVHQADQLLKQGQVIAPANPNAYTLYQSVLKTDPQNKAARSGLEQIENWFVGQIRHALSKQELLAARDTLAVAKNYFPQSHRYTALKDEIEATIDTTLPKISQVSFSAQPFSSLQVPNTLDKLKPSETLYGGFAYKNFYETGSLVTIKLTAQEGTAEYDKRTVSLDNRQGEYFFDLQLPKQGTPTGNYSVEFYLNDVRILRANLSGLH